MSKESEAAARESTIPPRVISEIIMIGAHLERALVTAMQLGSRHLHPDLRVALSTYRDDARAASGRFLRDVVEVEAKVAERATSAAANPAKE